MGKNEKDNISDQNQQYPKQTPIPSLMYTYSMLMREEVKMMDSQKIRNSYALKLVFPTCVDFI